MVNLELLFPKLNDTGYEVTSPAQRGYNCIAWAAGDDSRWWEPDSFGQYYWPKGLPRMYAVATYAEAFRSLGFEACNDATYEVGNEKVAIFADLDGNPTHAARQLDDGTWTSKLGQLEDIKHVELDHVSGRAYGNPVLILRRRRFESNRLSS